jgi:hypothetical protein
MRGGLIARVGYAACASNSASTSNIPDIAADQVLPCEPRQQRNGHELQANAAERHTREEAHTTNDRVHRREWPVRHHRNAAATTVIIRNPYRMFIATDITGEVCVARDVTRGGMSPAT